MHHSSTSHGLISFFYYITDRSICNVIHNFQTDQFICDCLHGPVASTFRRFRTGVRADMCLHFVGHFTSSVLLLFSFQSGSHRPSDAPESGGTVPDIFDFCFCVFLFHVRKPSRPLCTSPPETGRFPADFGYGFPLQPGTNRNNPGSKDGLLPESAHTSLLPISLRISSRQRYIYSHRLPALSRQ